MKSIACPSCAAPMERHGFSRKPHGGVDLDLCFACHAIWFDQFESAQLTPGAAPAGWAVAPEGLVDLVGEALDFLMSD